ncbi:MAG: WG repeat-containing protein [Fibrobacterota bacterium]|nr:WG repeat-containing protein [Fibrobacterota bacterium]
MLKPFKKEGKWGYCDEHNHAVIPPRFALASRFSQGLAAVAVLGPASKAWGYIGESGEIAIAPRFQEAMDFHEDLAAVRAEPSQGGPGGPQGGPGGSRWGYIDRTGSLVIEPIFDKVGEFSEGLAVVWKDGKAGYLDTEGHTVIEPHYAHADPFRGGLARVRMTDGTWTHIDRHGRQRSPHGYLEAESYSEGLAAIKPSAQGGWGYIDTDDRMVIPATFDKAFPFQEGRGRVVTGAYPHGKYGFIDKQGQFIVKPRYHEAEDFQQGVARAKFLGGDWRCFDSSGNLLIPASHRDHLLFSEGRARTLVDGKWGFVDRTYAFCIPPRFDEAGHFYLGLASIKVDGSKPFDAADQDLPRSEPIAKPRWGYIDVKGALAIPARYLMAGSFSEDLAAVKVHAWLGFATKWGYINRSGQTVIKPAFDFAYPFSEGLARVNMGGRHGRTGEVQGGRWGFIDKNGNYVIKPQFEYVSWFAENLAVVRVGTQWGYIDGKGTVIIPPQFDEAYNFFKGLARVRIADQWFYVDSSGKKKPIH